MQTNHPDESQHLVRARLPQQTGVTSTVPHVLVVDDDPELLKLIGRVFDRIKDVKVTCFTSPLEALNAFLMDPHKFSLVLTDYKMPVMNGEELADQIHSVRQEMPIVAITGSTWEFRKMDTFVRVIEKPFGPADILKLIADWFEERPR